MTRRHGSVLAAGVAAVLMVGIAAPGGAQSTPSSDGYRSALVTRLTDELRDATLAETVVAGLGEEQLAALESRVPVADVPDAPFLAYRNVPRVKAKKVDSVIVYAFGYRTAPDGTLLPGPANEALAAATRKFVRRHHVPVFAQTEIAQLLLEEGVKQVTSIDPTVGPDGQVVYLSTAGVVAQVREKAEAGGIDLGTVGVLGFSDHAVRCVLTTQTAGLDAAVPKGVRLPSTYDSESSQPWTRDRASYIPVDLTGRFATL